MLAKVLKLNESKTVVHHTVELMYVGIVKYLYSNIFWMRNNYIITTIKL